VGRLVSFVKTGAEQAQPFPEALFGDLALEHQLLDRARYVKVLAKELGDKSAVSLAERLETAHSATVEWLTTVLAEEALGGPAALRPTPLQVAVAGAYRIAILPGRWAIERVNTAASTLSRSTEEAREVLVDLRGKAAQLGGSAIEALGSVTRQGEDRARVRSGASAAEKVHEARRSVGVLEPDELPIKGYQDMPATAAAEAVKKLSNPEDVRAIVRFEETHKDRSTVVSAAQTTLARIAQNAVNN
jgi:hypothetical protein